MIDGDITKTKKIYDLPINEFLYWCMYFKAKNEETERQVELQKIRNGNIR